ncbi:threonyl-tRNA synthetase [Streptomyces sp. Termitarium-T10T-6]|nr:threonyl-tRNA synthetase [Streptomyces sp. Termitarium-T10T-6]
MSNPIGYADRPGFHRSAAAWLAPTQLVILPISGTELPNAAALARRCARLGLRAQVVGPDRGGLGARIREARPVPYQAVIGAREASADHVAPRLRDGCRLDPQPVSDVIDRISALIAAHSTELWTDATS